MRVIFARGSARAKVDDPEPRLVALELFHSEVKIALEDFHVEVEGNLRNSALTYIDMHMWRQDRKAMNRQFRQFRCFVVL